MWNGKEAINGNKSDNKNFTENDLKCKCGCSSLMLIMSFN